MGKEKMREGSKVAKPIGAAREIPRLLQVTTPSHRKMAHWYAPFLVNISTLFVFSSLKSSLHNDATTSLHGQKETLEVVSFAGVPVG